MYVFIIIMSKDRILISEIVRMYVCNCKLLTSPKIVLSNCVLSLNKKVLTKSKSRTRTAGKMLRQTLSSNTGL